MSSRSVSAVLQPYRRDRAVSGVLWAVLLYPVTAVAAFLLLWLRYPEVLIAPQLSAQDGTVFYATYLVDGPVRSLFVPDQGFLAMIPRLLTALLGTAEALHVPTLFAATSLAVAALCCGFFALPEYRYFLRNDLTRIVCCLAFASVPFAVDDVGSLASLSWYVCLPAMLLLALPRRGYNGRPFWFMLGAALVVLLAALSAPFLVVFVPLAGYKVYVGTSRVRIVCGAFLIGMGVQLMVSRLAGGQYAGAGDGSFAADALNLGAFRVVVDNVAGHLVSGSVSYGHAVIAGTLICIATLVSALLFIETRKKAAVARRLVYVVCAAVAAVLIITVASAFDSGAAPLRQSDPWLQVRYLFIPIALMFYFVACICEDACRPAREPFRALAFASCVTVALCSNYRLPPLGVDDWASQAPVIDGWRAAEAQGTRHSALDLPFERAGWTLSLPAIVPTP